MSAARTLQRTATLGRRRRQRYPISLPLQYIVEKTAGVGMTYNIGSLGLCMKTECVLPPGSPIALLLEWPAMLEGRLPLRIDIRGKILRSSLKGTAVEILSYEYRLAPGKISRKAAAQLDEALDVSVLWGVPDRL